MIVLRTLVCVSSAELRQIAVPCSSTTLAALSPERALARAAVTGRALRPCCQLAGGGIAARVRALSLTATVAHLVVLSDAIPTDWVADHLRRCVEEALVPAVADELVQVADAAAAPECRGWEARDCRHDALCG